MNQQDVFLVNMRELYARKIHKEPIWRESVYNKPPDLIPGTESGSFTVSFVVDWQMECIDYEIVEKDYTSAAKTEYYESVADSKQEQQNSGEKEAYSHIFDW